MMNPKNKPAPECLGNVSIEYDRAALCARGNSGLRTKATSVAGIVTPESLSDVSHIMSDASVQGTKIYPVSTGKNWGYGASSPVENDCILMDLSKLNQISDFDEELGIVRIEPGVTQGQLYHYLLSSPYMMDATGAGPDTSLMGNILERGFGHTAMGNRSLHFVVSDVVLADGSVVDLAEGNRKIARFGPAAGLHELMLQSNLVVVCSMYIQLKQRPEKSLRCIVELSNDKKLGEYIDIMRQLKQEGIFEGLPHIGNGLRAKGMFGKSGDKIKKQFGWTLATGIYGCSGVARAKAKRARELLKPVGKVTVVSEDQTRRLQGLLDIATKLWPGKSQNLAKRASSMSAYRELLSLVDGYPTDMALKGCYWKSLKQWSKDSDPIRDGCGFRWIAPVIPLKGKDVVNCLGMAEELYKKAGFEMAVTLTVVTPQMCQAILSIYFDTENEVERQRANQLAKQLKIRFAENNWIPYRVAVDEMQDIKDYTNAEVLAVRNAIKKAFDPENIIAPGRYAW